jgi:CDGSH-type Zn-finger protein
MKITVRNNGSLKVEGPEIELVDQEGRPYGLAGRTVISLCRCGRSQKKPFCDGSHNTGFESECTAHELPPPKV